MFLKFVFAIGAVVMIGASAFANDMQPQHDRWQPRYDQQWVCFAHSTHGGQVYEGQASYDQYQAQESAHQICEYYENHECDPHGCQVVYYDDYGQDHGRGNGW